MRARFVKKFEQQAATQYPVPKAEDRIQTVYVLLRPCLNLIEAQVVGTPIVQYGRTETEAMQKAQKAYILSDLKRGWPGYATEVQYTFRHIRDPDHHPEP